MIRRFPSVFVLTFVTGGIVLADQSRISSWVFLLVCLPLCLTGFFAVSVRKISVAAIAFGLSLLAFSAFHFAIRYHETGPKHVLNAAKTSGRCHVFGKIADWPDLRPDRTEFKIAVDSIPDRGLSDVSGAILLRITDTTTALQRGDRVEFYGRIYPIRQRTSLTSFDYGRHLNMKGVFGIVYLPTLLDVRVDRRNRYALLSLIDKLRDGIRGVLYADLTPTSAALASGFLIGETRDIPTDIYQRFRDSGTLHLLAVSGSNVALIVLFFVFLLRPLGLVAAKRATVLLTIILCFTLLSYGEPSVVRASLMASLVILAGLIQRRHDLNNVIAVAAVLILLFDPAQLFDIGFQLSFVIAWGLIFIMPRIAGFFRLFQNRWWYRWLVFPFLVSVVAQICSLGLIAYYFERIPIISPFANLLVVPMVSVGVVGILALLLAHLVLPLLGSFVGAWLSLLLESVMAVVRVMGSENIPAVSAPDLPVWTIMLFYLLLFLTAWSLGQKAIRRLVMISSMIIVNLILGLSILSAGNGRNTTKATLFNVPGGVAAIIQPSHQKHADLIITGMTGRRYSIMDKIIQPQLVRMGVDSLDDIFVLSADFDGLVEVLKLADLRSARRVFVDHRLDKSLRDIRVANPAPSGGCGLMTLVEAEQPKDLCGHSYRLTSSGLLLSADGSGIIFCDRFSPDLLNLPVMAGNLNLVMGSGWLFDDTGLPGTLTANFESVICSKIEQAEPGGVDHGLPGIPDGVYDLGLQGPITLNL